MANDDRENKASQDSASSRAASPVPELASSSQTPPVASPIQALHPPPQTPLSSPPSTRYKADDLVTLIVGPEKEKFIVHGHRLAETSVFFQAALEKAWKEGQSRIVELLEEDADHTEFYLDFVYGGALPTNDLQDEEQLSLEEPFVLLFDLYLFAERMLNKPMRNAIIKETVRLMSLKDVNGNGWFPDWESAASVYRRTIPTSRIRYFLVDILVSYGSPKWLEGVDMRGNTDLLVDVVREFNRRAMRPYEPMVWRGRRLRAELYFD